MPLAEKVEVLSWEPTGYRFALLTQDKNNVRNISFYGTTQQKGHETVNETGLLCGCRGGA